jgi:PAS domain S-box-containing protein
MMRAIAFGRSWLGNWGGRLTIAHGLVMIWFVTWLLLGTASADHKRLVTDIIQPLFSLGCVIFAFRASRQKSLDPKTRRAWRILTVAFLVYFTANIIWFYYEIIIGGDLGLTWADPFYFAVYPIVLAGLLTFPMVRSGRSRLTFVLDAGTVMLAALMGIWHLILRPIALAGGTSSLVTIVSVAFPVMASVTLFGIVTIMLRRPDRKVRVTLAILTVAIFFDALAVLGYSYMTLQSNYEGGNWPDCFYAIGFFLMVLSAQVQYRESKRVEPRDFALLEQRSPFPWLPYVAVGFAYGLLLLVSYRHAEISSYAPVWLTIGAFMITGLVVVRQIVALRENAKLLAERATRATEARFVSLVEESSDVITITDPEGKVIYESPSVERVFGYSVAEALGKKLGKFVHPDDRAEIIELMARLCRHPGMRGHMKFRLLHKDGQYVDVEAAMTNLLDDPNVRGIVINSRDVSERKQAEQALKDSEDQLRQSQKMDAVGQLAGGVAHDFNNLLAVIIGYSDLLLMRGSSELTKGTHLKVEQINKAGHRAAGLTRQLLAFSRKQVLQPKLLDLNAVVSDMDKMLKRLIGEHIDILTIPGSELGTVKADPGQIEQVLLNLAVNARDAMSGGGKLTIETANVTLDRQFTQAHRAVEPGPYVMLAVSDTGAGMSPEVKSRIFEPFYTTKAAEKGTGLGLSTVYGIVKQSGGSIWVYSEPGHGSTFKVYLPCVAENADVEGDQAAPSDYRGEETVLLVEDEESVREVANEILTINGYKVLLASQGNEALKISREHEGTIDLMVTDVVMPLMGGPELARQLALTRPQMRVLYMSGYTDDAIVHHGVLSEGTAYLQKPFTAVAFARKLRETISVSQN